MKLLLIVLMLGSLSTEVKAQSRRELKRMCRQEFRLCKESNSRKFCRAEKRQCRKENGVTLKDDLIHVKNKVVAAAKQLTDHVEVFLQEDLNGEAVLVRIKLKGVKNLQDIEFSPKDTLSKIKGYYLDSLYLIDILLYTKDFEKGGFGVPLQTTEGRRFPRFLYGQYFNELTGKQLNKGHQFYLDHKHGIFGVFVKSKGVGNAMEKINDLKHLAPKIAPFIPEINSIPINVKVHKEKVGRISILSNDEGGENSGVVVLFDHSLLKDAIRN